MGLPFTGPVNVNISCCDSEHSGQPPDTLPYVVSLFSLRGIINLGDTGAITWRSIGNTIYADLNASAGLGSVTSVGITSSSLTVTGSPITTLGDIDLELSGATASIQGLVTAADKMIYTTASNVYAVTDLTAFARTLLDDANNTAARFTLGLVIGTNVQAWSADLDTFVTVASWAGINLTLSGGLNVGGALSVTSDLNVGGDTGLGGDVAVTGGLTANTGSFAGAVVALSFTGIGTGLTALNAANIASGTLAVARGGTGFSSYTTGSILHADTGSTIGQLLDVAVGSYLRSGGVGANPVWSTLTLPNAATIGDILYASGANAIGRLADVATGNALISGGVATAPAWGKITTAHTTGIAASGANNDITSLAQNVTASGIFTFTNTVSISGQILDFNGDPAASGFVLVGNGSGATWTNQLVLDTLRIDTSLSIEGTITGAGVTGNQTINKPSGTVRFAAAGTNLIVTNSLATTGHRVLATVCTNDSALKSVQAVVTNGAFTLFANAAANAECEVYWQLVAIS